jgi:preprotein translocase subunit SecE
VTSTTRGTRCGGPPGVAAAGVAGPDAGPEPTDQVGTVTTSPATKSRRRGGSLGLFIRQVVAELKKVVRPTRNELLTYTSVVLVFVCAVMAFVSLLDYGFGKLVLLVFGGG